MAQQTYKWVDGELITAEKLNNSQDLLIDSAQTYINVKQYGVVGDGIADDSESLQNAINSALKGQTIFFEEKMLVKITKPIFLNENTTIDFNNSKIVWNGVVDDNKGRFIGVLNAKGNLLGETYNIKNVVLHGDDTQSDSTNYFIDDGHFEVDDASLFNVGDWLLLNINTGEYNVSKLNPKDEKLLKIVRIVNNTLYVNYSSPFKYENYDYTATIQKVDPVENITIKNLDIYDPKIINTKTPTTSDPDVLTYVSGISIQYGINIKFENVNGENTKLPVIFLNHVSNITLNGGELNGAAIVGPGEGYYSQFNYCNNIIFENVSAHSARHLVDFTGSSYALVVKCNARKMYSMAFQLHGAYEHNIYYKDSTGTFNNASGTIFGNANAEIDFYNHHGWLTSNGFSYGYRISNSKVKLSRAFTDLKVVNSDVILDFGDQRSYTYVPDSRTLLLKRLYISSSNVDILSNISSTVVYDYDYFNIIGGVVNILKDYSGTELLLDFNNVKNISFAYTTVTGLKTRIISPNPIEIFFDLSNSKWNFTSNDWHFSAKNVINSTLNVLISESSFRNKLDSNQINAINFITANGNSTSRQIVKMINNDLYGCVVNSSYSSASDVIVSVNNILKNSIVNVSSDITNKKIDNIVI